MFSFSSPSPLSIAEIRKLHDSADEVMKQFNSSSRLNSTTSSMTTVTPTSSSLSTDANRNVAATVVLPMGSDPPTAAASTLELLRTSPESTPSHPILEAKRIDMHILVDLLNVWIEDDSEAISFALIDARFSWTLYHRYRVKRKMDLSTVLNVWRRRIADAPECSEATATSSTGVVVDEGCVDPMRFVPLLGEVKSYNPAEYGNVSPRLLARFTKPCFAILTNDLRAIPEGTTMIVHLGECPIDEHVLPATVKWLKFDIEAPFDFPIGENVLSTSLQRLTFGHSFNQPIGRNVLPASLQQLEFGGMFNHPIGEYVLPASLQQLTFCGYFNQRIGVNVLPVGLLKLTFDANSSFNHPIGVNVLPASLQQLTFCGAFNHPIGENVLPASLLQLTLGNEGEVFMCDEDGRFAGLGGFNHPIGENVLPASLMQLTFGWAFNHPIAVHVLPTSLQQLTFGEQFNHPIGENVLPASLQLLTFGNQSPFNKPSHFNHPIDKNVLPASLQQLTFGCQSHFNQPIGEKVLPRSLQRLKFGHDAQFKQHLVRLCVPPDCVVEGATVHDL